MEHRAAALADVPPGQPTRVELAGTPVVLTRVGESVYACGDVWTGQCLFPPRGAAVPSYPVRVDGESVFVEMP